MSKKVFENSDLSKILMELGLTMTSTKPGTIMASKAANRANSESFETKLNKKINKILR